MTDDELISNLKKFLISAYPNIQIRIEPSKDDASRRAIYFVEEKFAVLYPLQRFHYLIHHIPKEFYDQHLENSEWYELAPGESPEDLRYPDDELIKDITPDVMRCFHGSRFFEKLDDEMCPPSKNQAAKDCMGDFRIAKAVLTQCGFSEEEHFDMLHVLMEQGAYCDCEILYNVVEDNRLKAKHWKKRAKEELERRGVKDEELGSTLDD